MLSSSEIDQLLKQEGYAPSDFGDLESQMEQWERELGLSPASEVTTQDTKRTTSKAEEPKVEESKVTKEEATTAQKVDKAARRDLDKSRKSPKPATETKTQHHGQQPPACPKTQSDRHAPENVDKAGTNKQIFKNIPQISYPEQKEPVLPPEILRLREAAKESQRRRLAAKAQANAENAKNAKTTSSLAAQKQNSGDDSTEVRNAKRLNTVSSTRPHRLCIKGKNVAAAALEAANQERAKDIQTIRISARNSIIISSSRGSGSSSHAMSLNVQSQPQPLVTKRGVKRSAATQENDIPTNTPESCRAERPVKRPNIPHHIRCETIV